MKAVLDFESLRPYSMNITNIAKFEKSGRKCLMCGQPLSIIDFQGDDRLQCHNIRCTLNHGKFQMGLR